MTLVAGLLFLALFSFTISNEVPSRAVSTLKFLVVVSKHGARGPTHTYPRDPYKDRSLWPDGPGQITRVGKQQMFRVGQRLRQLYNGYLSHFYTRTQILVQSTLVDRTMLSALTLLAGLYPPQGFQMWNPEIPWQPIPVYPNLLDKALLSLDPSHCPRYVKEQNASLDVLREQNVRYADIYKAMSEGTGRNLSSCSQMYLLCNNFAALAENNLPLPNWGETIFLPRMLPVVSEMVRNTTLKNAKMIKILNGMFLKKMLDLMKWRLNLKAGQEREELHAFVHVGHDITLMCLLAAMGVSGDIPWSSTTLLIELHDNPSLPSTHQVQVLKIDGRSNSTDTPEPIELPGCKSPCDLNDFIAFTEKYTTMDWQKECHDMDSPSD